MTNTEREVRANYRTIRISCQTRTYISRCVARERILQKVLLSVVKVAALSQRLDDEVAQKIVALACGNILEKLDNRQVDNWNRLITQYISEQVELAKCDPVEWQVLHLNSTIQSRRCPGRLVAQPVMLDSESRLTHIDLERSFDGNASK